jgi:hypothetical protein
MRLPLSIALLATVFFLPGCLYAQTSKIEQEIQHKALQTINSLQLLMNTLTDQTTLDSDKLKIVFNSYDPSSTFCIFVDEKVIIEDDYSDPSFTDYTKAVDRPVETYLSNLDAFYTSSTVPSVAFSNMKTGKLKILDNILIRVYFESEFKNPHKQSKSSYQKTKRVAIIKAQKVGLSYKTFIAGISFYRPEDASEFFPEGVPATNTQTDAIKQPPVKTEQAPVKTEQAPPTAAKYSIDMLKSSYKRGKEYPFSWQGGRPADQVTLDLYKGDKKVSSVFTGANKGNTQALIPSQARPGSDYTMRISENGNEAVQSSKFKIKRRTPFILKPLAVVAGAVAAFLIIDPCLSDCGEDSEDLPDPRLPGQQ